MKYSEFSDSARGALFNYLLRLGDDCLINGHRLSEWCGHGPVLEEDIALANMALDNIGHATNFLKLAGLVEGKGRDEDRLSFFRDTVEFKNASLLELPNGDFAFTIARQFLFSAYSVVLFTRLKESACEELAALADKTLKEVTYHLRHSAEWVVRLGDGTRESKERIERAFNALWRYAFELFNADSLEQSLSAEQIVVNSSDLFTPWRELVDPVLIQATLTPIPDQPQDTWQGSRKGLHTEHLGHLLAEMQSLPRAYPEAKW